MLLAMQPGSVPPLVVLHQHSSTVPRSTTAFCQASRSAPQCSPYPRHVLRLAFPGAPSAPVRAPVLRRSIRPRRGPCALCLGFSPVSAITTPPSTASRVPALPCAPAALRSLPPLLVSVTPSPYPPPPAPTPRVLLPCSSPRFSSARPSCTPLAPGPRRFSVLLLPRPTRRPRTTPSAATAPAASESWASSPSPGDSPGSPPGAPLLASSSTGPPPSQAPFPWASLPCRPGR